MAYDAALSIEISEGNSPTTRIIRLNGPVTMRNLFDFQDQLRAGPTPETVIMDMSEVPYMDSAGMGAVINYYVFCQRNQTKMIVAGVSVRVMELFKMTKVDSVIAIAASVEDAESTPAV